MPTEWINARGPQLFFFLVNRLGRRYVYRLMQHLTDKELIDYQFKLAGQDQAERTAGHLATCEQCQRRASQLAKRLSALDLLRYEPALTEELIGRTLEQAARPRPSSTLRFKALPWIGAAAAVALVATTLAVWLHSGAGRRQEGPARFLALEKAKDTLASSATAPASLKRTTHEPQPTTSGSEPPPFAPASAIELVTLPRREGAQLTIYNSADLTLVRDRRNLTLKKGWNWLQFMWANTLIDPTSLDLEPSGHEDRIEVRQLVYPAGSKDIGRWLIHSRVEGQVPFEITYFTSGISWRAFYMGTLSPDERTMRLEGYVLVINNSGEDYENAQVRLIVGQIHLIDRIAELAKREFPFDSPNLPRERKVENAKDRYMAVRTIETLVENKEALGLKEKEIVKEGLSEYFLYTIEGTETIPNAWSKRLVSMEANDVPVKNLYKYEEDRYGRSAVRFLSFKNDREHRLGQTPIPDGQINAYHTVDDASHLSYIGGAGFKYIPVGQEVELDLGEVRDVAVEPRLMDFKTENFKFNTHGDIDGWDEDQTFHVQARNTRAVPVKVEVRRNLPTPYWDLTRTDGIGTYERIDKDTVKFTLDLAARSSQSFGYQLKTYRGTREADWQAERESRTQKTESIRQGE